MYQGVMPARTLAEVVKAMVECGCCEGNIRTVKRAMLREMRRERAALDALGIMAMVHKEEKR